MRKTQGQGYRPADRIASRAERAGIPRPVTQSSHPLRPSPEPRKIAVKTVPRDGATMDYQMGFASGSSI